MYLDQTIVFFYKTARAQKPGVYVALNRFTRENVKKRKQIHNSREMYYNDINSRSSFNRP